MAETVTTVDGQMLIVIGIGIAGHVIGSTDVPLVLFVVV